MSESHIGLLQRVHGRKTRENMTGWQIVFTWHCHCEFFCNFTVLCGKRDKYLVANFLLSPTVEEFWKSANFWQSHERKLSWVFLTHSVYKCDLPVVDWLKLAARSGCLPQPVRTTQSEIVKIYTIIFVDFLLLIFECYALRLRPLICGFFYRKAGVGATVTAAWCLCK